MNNNPLNDNWIEAIKRKAEQSTMDVPADAWEKIAQAMPQPASMPQPQAKPRAKVAPRLLWKALAAAAAIAIVVTTGFFLINDNNTLPPTSSGGSTTAQNKEQPATTPAGNDPQATASPAATTPLLAQATTPAAPTAQPGMASHAHSGTSAATHHHHSSSHGTAQQQAHPQDEEYYAQDYDNDINDGEGEFNPDKYFYDIETMQALEELYAQYDNAMNQEAMDPWKSYADSSYHQYLVYDANALQLSRERERNKTAVKKEKAEMLMAAYGNGLITGDRNSTENGGTAMLTPATPGGGIMMMSAQRVAPPVGYSYHHHMPLTFGVTASKKIVGNLYGNLGLNFTSMSSDVTPDNGGDSFEQKIKLVGLPFGVKWNFWRYKGLTTYVGGEGLMERVVNAKFGDEKVKINRLQWSVHATAGVQYNFSKHVGLYLEPKLSHYITTMPLNTLRNEHPLNFNLQMGISLDF